MARTQCKKNSAIQVQAAVVSNGELACTSSAPDLRPVDGPHDVVAVEPADRHIRDFVLFVAAAPQEVRQLGLQGLGFHHLRNSSIGWPFRAVPLTSMRSGSVSGHEGDDGRSSCTAAVQTTAEAWPAPGNVSGNTQGWLTLRQLSAERSAVILRISTTEAGSMPVTALPSELV